MRSQACFALGCASIALVWTLGACAGSGATREDAGARSTDALAARGETSIPEGRALAVRGDVRIAPGEYLRPALGVDRLGGVIVIEGVRGATLDLRGVVLRGTPAGSDLDRNEGYGIVVRDSSDVVIRGGKVGGYKGCLVAERCERLVIEDVEFDGWYGQRLKSSQAGEDASDWLWPHDNDQGEWLAKYGAAISLTDCDGAVVRRSRGRHGQNGILLTRCEDARVHDNDFSFLSGWGLALYRSSKNVVDHNLFDYCVRGYSHGVYWRGQDSAGILMFERCTDNLFAYNSATHGGDGVFLFAGRDLVDGRAAERGEAEPGGSDRNVWYRNDLSFAVANSIEATFSSDNWAIGNVLSGSHQHGVWGGYSRRMVVLDNTIEGTLGGAVSIEHGQECAVVTNRIRDNDVGVELWWDEDPDLVGGPFGRRHDTASRDHWVEGNLFAGNVQDLALRRTSGVALRENRWARSEGALRIEGSTVVGAPREPRRQGAEGGQPKDVRDWLVASDGSRPSGVIADASIDVGRAKAPDFLERAKRWQPPALPGRQKTFASERGERQGLDTIVVGEWGPWDWRSGEPRPAMRAPGGLLADARWKAVWFSWKGGPDPRGDYAGWRALAGSALVVGEVGPWVNFWGGDEVRRKQLGPTQVGLVATAKVMLPERRVYRLAVTSDDGVRVRIDGRMALENWTWHGPTRDERSLELAEGEHEIELEYFQIDGASALSVELE